MALESADAEIQVHVLKFDFCEFSQEFEPKVKFSILQVQSGFSEPCD